MMQSKRMVKKLQAGQIVLCIGNMFPASGIIECMCSGWDVVWIDCQHGQIGYESALHAVQASDAIGIDTLIRVPGHEAGVISPYLDLAPTAIMVPMVNNAEQAHQLVQLLRFPPLGQRSYGGRRAIDLNTREYYRTSEPLIVAQIETVEAVANAEAIIEIDGIDMLFFGSDDIKVDMQIPIDTPISENEQLLSSFKRVGAVARSAGKKCGVVAPSPDMVQLSMESGYQLIVGGGDVGFLRVGASGQLRKMQEIIDGVSHLTGESNDSGMIYGK